MSSQPIRITILPADHGKRIDVALTAYYPDFSRNYFQKLITSGFILLNGEGVKKRALVEKGDEIEIIFLESAQMPLVAQKLPLDILYEDPYFLAINKPAGMVVHPGAGNPDETFANALLYHCDQLKTEGLRPGIVHRLDKETSGVLLGAKEAKTQQLLSELFADRNIEKIYYAITIGNPGNQTIDAPIGRHPTRRTEMAIDYEKGRQAQTSIQTLATTGKLSFVKLTPKTGRTHQIRVHLKSLGCPILGDSLYGIVASNEKWKAKRQMLHAQTLSFKHPYTKEHIEIRAPYPEDFQTLLNTHFK